MTERAVRSGVWLYGRHLVENLASLASMAVLARQLSPSDFGLVALASVLLRVLAVLSAGGVDDYVIQDRAEGREERASAAFWLNATMTLVTAGVAVVCIPLIDRLFDHPELPALLTALVIKYALDMTCVLPDGLVKRTLDYRWLTLRDGAIVLSSALLSVVLALAGYGVWSLVIPAVLASLVRLVVVFLVARWRPRLALGLAHWRRILGYSSSVIGTNVIVLITNEGDTLLIGKTLGAHELGIYNNAWNVANLVQKNTAGVVGKLALPALSAVAGEPARLRAGFVRMIRTLGIISMPAFVGMFVLADLFVLTLYGAKWMACVLPLRILIIFAMRRAIGSPATAVYGALGRPDLSLKLGLGILPFYLAAIYVGGLWGGIVGVAIGVTVVRSLFGVVQFKVTAWLIGESLAGLMRPLWPILGSSLVMGALVWGVRLGVERVLPGTPAPVLLGGLALVGVGIYAVLLRTVFQGVRDEVLSLAGSVGEGLQRRVGGVLGRSRPAA